MKCPFIDRTSIPEAGRPLSSRAPGPGPGASLAVADLDEDGTNDVIASRGVPHTPGSLEIHYGADSSAPPVILGLGKQHGGVAVGDVGGDSCPDLVVALEQSYLPGANTGGVDVYLGHRRGAGQPCELLTEPTPIALPPRSAGATFGGRVTLVDFDGDGKLDVAVTQMFPNSRTPTQQYLCMNKTAAAALAFECEPLATTLGGALDVAVADFDGDGSDDVLFGGVTAQTEAGEAHPGAWGVLALGGEHAGRELIIHHECAGECPAQEFPNLVDFEVMPQPQGPTRVAAVFSHHVCSSRDECGARAVAKVVELQPDIELAKVNVRELWTSKGTCNGSFSAITAAVQGSSTPNPALVIGYLGGRDKPTPGHLMIVPSDGDGWGAPESWHYLMDRSFYAYALLAVEAPTRDGIDILYIPAFNQLPQPIHILELTTVSLNP